MKVGRDRFLHALQSVQAGIDQKGLVEQSRCFVFHQGHVMTYNDEVFCRASSGLSDDIEGAVDAKPLASVIEQIDCEELNVVVEDKEFCIYSGDERAWVRMDQEITSPLMLITLPKEWKRLAPDFSDALKLIEPCVGKDETMFSLTCVHVCPDWLEGCDDIQICRWNLKTGVQTPVLVRGKALIKMADLGMTEVSEDTKWLHFRGPDSLTFSCRRYLEAYQDLSGFLEVEGENLVLPKEITAPIKKAKLFAEDNMEAKQIQVRIKKGKMSIKGEGFSGGYEKSPLSVEYSGEPLIFYISPDTFSRIAEKHHECVVSKDKLKVQGSNYTYITCLVRPEELHKEKK